MTLTNRELTPLPRLIAERVDPLVTTLSPDVAKVDKQRRDLFARAVKVRAVAETKMAAVHKARDEDTQRLTQSYLDGKKGDATDRKSEDKAFAEAEVAHREAVAITYAANAKLAELHHVLRNNADATKTKAHEKIKGQADELLAATEKVSGLVEKIAQMDGAIEAVEWSEKDNVGSRFQLVTPKHHEVVRLVDQITAFAEIKRREDNNEIA